MRAVITSILFFILSINTVNAYELYLPESKKSVNNGQYALFIGKVKKTEDLTINDQKINVASNGAFAYSVKLKNGENRIIVKSNFNRKIYKIYKDDLKNQYKPELKEFDIKKYKVKKDNTPLRSTPEDFGMNRISHLFAGTNLLINGSKGEFYRVYLAKNKTAWIASDAVEEVKNTDKTPEFITMNSKTYKNASVHTIEFTDKLPYTIEESAKEIVFKVYNPEYADNSVYTVNIKKPEKYYYKTVLSNGVYVFKVCEVIPPETNNLEGITIVVDAGHGGSERGAIGCLGDKEKDINLKIAQDLRELLVLMGANVIMTRDCDGTVSLDERVKIAKENSADIFVSVHLNSIPESVKMDWEKNRGTSVYYYNPNSKDLAKAVEDSVTSSAGTRKDGVKTASLAVIRPADYLGILVECAYMTNPLDSLMYTKDNFAQNISRGIADGILNYLNRK